MTDPINVDVGAMLTAVSECEDTHDGVFRQVIALQGEIGALTSTWSGETANTFVGGAMSSFYELCDTILKALSTLASDIDASAIKYNAAHHLNNDAAQALQKQIHNDPIWLPGC